MIENTCCIIMSEMAELGQTSSMTSVTEEDTSADSESDTTESSYSHITSSVLSSTDTDDKLTPGLTNISISNATSTAGSPTKKRQLSQDVEEIGKDTSCEVPFNTEAVEQDISNQSSVKESPAHDLLESAVGTTVKDTNFVFPYGSNPLPLEHAGQDERRRWKDNGLSPQGGALHKCPRNLVSRCKENLGVDDTDNKLSTDFSDTSSIQAAEDRTNNNEFEVESNEEGEEYDANNFEGSESQRPFYPDLNSASWYQARCFDHYWAHYNFVMEWYQEHVKAVRTLQGHMTSPWRFPPTCQYSNGAPSARSERSKKKKRSRRARSRRCAKARQRASEGSSESLSLSMGGTDTDSVSRTSSSASSARRSRTWRNNKKGEDDDEEDIEMEITDEMMEFFTTSFKHRMERDGAKNGSDNTNDTTRLNIEEAKGGDQGPTSAAPSERPGVRRTAEMRELYGAGAPMIHGMETALQMTFDRISDRFQPKLWPNMPLKIVFA